MVGPLQPLLVFFLISVEKLLLVRNDSVVVANRLDNFGLVDGGQPAVVASLAPKLNQIKHVARLGRIGAFFH